MDELITIGQIIKAQGLKGEVKIKPFTNDLTRFKKLRAVTIDSAPLRILSLRLSSPFVYMMLAGIDTREAAEALRNKFIKIDRVHAKALDEGEFFITDLIGADFFVDAQKIGKVKEIMQNGSADVFVVELLGGKSLMFPFLNRLELEIDVENKTINAQSARLQEVAVYED